MADAHAFADVTGLPCWKFLDYMHDVLGDPTAAEPGPKPMIEDESSGDSVLVVMDYKTRYPIEIAREHFEWQIDGAHVRLMSYHVAADALSR